MGRTLDSEVAKTLRKSPFLLTVDSHTFSFEAIQNPLASPAVHDSRKIFHELLGDNQVRVILIGGYRCHEAEKLRDKKIRVFLGITGTVREAVEKFNKLKYVGAI